MGVTGKQTKNRPVRSVSSESRVSTLNRHTLHDYYSTGSTWGLTPSRGVPLPNVNKSSRKTLSESNGGVGTVGEFDYGW